MLLYLRNENLYRIDTIELIDGCYPSITYDVGTFGSDGVRSPPPTEEYSMTELNIEPAIWGIILVLDKICVDVKRRRCSWATASIGRKLDDEGTEDPLYRTHYADDERYEYDDNIDELFNLADHLITISHSRTKSIRESHEEQSSLIRMLYCCILPKIKLYEKDLGKVDEALQKQMSYIEKLGNNIDRASKNLGECYNMLFKQHDERLPQFENIALQKKCTKGFIMAIDTDLKKRKNKLYSEIDKNQGIVQKLKADIEANGMTEERERQLDEARKLSAYLDRLLQRVLIASVDTIGESLEGEGFQADDNETVVLEYLESRGLVTEQKKMATRETEKQVRATSVLQNLKRIKQDVIDYRVASATTASSHLGVRPTDVITYCHVPEYQTLSEHVTSIVNNSEHPFGDEFQKFTSYVEQQCQSILEGVESSRGSRKQRKNANSFVLVENDGTLQAEVLTPLEKLCEEIRVHSEHTAQLLVEQFSSIPGRTLICKLQLCYEENFYNKVGADLLKVYETAYKKHKEKLMRDLEVLSTYPIKCLDLGMKKEWWLDLFETRRKLTVARHRSLSNPIPCRTGSKTDSCTPPASVTSSSSSSSSMSSHASSKDHECIKASPNDRPCAKQVTPKGKKSPSTLRRKFLSMIKRKSREVSEAEDGEIRISNNDNYAKCYDNYDSYKANRMSSEIGCNGSCTNNNETCIANGIDSDEAAVNPDPSLTSFHEEANTINGNEEAKIINGNEEAKIINGNEEAKIINGNEEAKVINGNEEAKIINGNEEAKIINGNEEAKIINGNEEAKIINGNEEAKIINGNEEAKIINGNEEAKIINGNEEAKIINGNEEAKIINGSEEETSAYENAELSKFVKYFGPSLDCLKDVFQVSSVFSKLRCLTQSLTKVTDAVQELREQVLDKVENEFSLAITADDLLPLMVLIILQMDTSDAAGLVVELKMLQDLIPRFLSVGCHGWALVEFDMASKVLQSLCIQFDWSASFRASS